MENKENRITHFDLATFTRAKEQMIATNDNAYKNFLSSRKFIERTKEYTLEEVEQIISSGSIVRQQALSRNYFNRDGFYKRIILHYASLLMYAGLLIPQAGYKKDLSKEKYQKRYYSAINFIENNDLPILFTNWAIRCFRDGGYYGIIQGEDTEMISIIDLPAEYCSSNFKDTKGNDIIEFDLNYFRSIIDENKRKAVLNVYPKFIRQAFNKFDKGKSSQYVIIPSDIGICFPLFDGRPLFLNVIPSTINYENTVELEQEKALEEIKKIIVQKIPHSNDNTLLFEPDEAAVIHDGTVQMMKGNRNVSVLTTYADVDSIVSKTSNETSTTLLENMMNNIFNQAGTSSQLFGASTNSTLETSIKNDLALVMILAHKFAKCITNIINRNFGKNDIKFKYTILPISYYNYKDYIENSFKLASFGYSFIMPILGLGLTQGELSGLKDLENDILQLNEKLLPLSSSYTQSDDNDSNEQQNNISGNNVTTDPNAGSPGAPQKSGEQKQETTITKEKSLEQ